MFQGGSTAEFDEIKRQNKLEAGYKFQFEGESQEKQRKKEKLATP